tara:strand:- start:11883 stop:12479 length:597 start_codon:yes stop_codon:yes gene_type:complete
MRRGTTTFSDGFRASGWTGAGNNPFGGKSGNFQAQNQQEKELGYKAIQRGENRMGQDESLKFSEALIKSMLGSPGQLPELSEAQKKVEIDRAESSADAQFKSNMGNLAKVAGASGIGATGRYGKSTLASGKEQYGAARAKSLADARAGITAGTIRNAQQAQLAAGNLGLGIASGRSAAAQPFTMQESKARFGTSFPNV